MAADNQMLLPWMQQQTKPPSSILLPTDRGGKAAASNMTAGSDQLLAPAPYIDRFPIVIGNSLTLGYITATYRLATEGWRWQAIDVWNELLEHDPHARGVIRQRLLPVVASRMDVLPRELPEDASAKEKKLALATCAEVKRQLTALPARTQALGRLMWGVPYGMSGSEIQWDLDKSSPAPKGWEVRGLHFIHSRRLNCTNPGTWDVYIYDQGPVGPWSAQNISLGYGMRIADYPGKFILHSPALNGDYATRDGELRYIGIYMALKRMIVRCTAQDFERVIRPWVIGYFNREQDKNKNSVATTPDINQLLATVKALGLGSLSSAVLPDAVRVEILKQIASAGNPREFAEWLDDQVTESLLGQTYTTGPATHGTHDAAGVAQSGTIKIHEYDAQCLSDSLERDLVYWIVAQNWDHDVARRYAPTLRFAVSDKPDPKVVAEVAKLLTAIDIPLDARKTGEMAGMPVIPEGDKEAIRTRVITGGKDTPIEPEAGNDPNEGGSGAPAVSEDAPGQQAPAQAGKQPGKPAPGKPAPKPAAKPAPKPAKKPAKGKAPAKGSKGEKDKDASGAAMYDRDTFLLSDKERSDDARILLKLARAPVAQIGDREVAVQVYEHLLEDYPAKSLDWIADLPWQKLVVPIEEIDFSNANRWQASHDDIGPYVEKVRKAEGNWKPIVLVKRPGNPKFMIVDGHHRVLAYLKLGWPIPAFLATVPTEKGPWDELHDLQKKGTSKGSWANESSPSWTASHQPSWATRPSSYQGPGQHPLEEPSVRPPSVNNT